MIEVMEGLGEAMEEHLDHEEVGGVDDGAAHLVPPASNVHSVQPPPHPPHLKDCHICSRESLREEICNRGTTNASSNDCNFWWTFLTSLGKGGQYHSGQ